jgi:hypothetical protein
MSVRRGQPDWCSKHILELLKEHQHQVIDIQGVHLQLVAVCGHTLPHDTVVVEPTTQTCSAKIP